MSTITLPDGRDLELEVRGPEEGPVIVFHHGTPGASTPLPAHVREQARAAYALFQQNPSHPGLPFKQVDSGPPPVYSARVGIAYRALGTVEGDTVEAYAFGPDCRVGPFDPTLQYYPWSRWRASVAPGGAR